MALQADNTLISNREILIEVVMTPLRAFGHMLEMAAETNARTRALQAANAVSDAELQDKGMTRAELVAASFHHDA